MIEQISSRRKQITSIGKDVGKMEALYTISENVNWYSVMENSTEAP